MYLIILKEPVDGKLQVETEIAKLDTDGIWIYPGKTWEHMRNKFIPLTNIDSIIVKPE